MKGILLVPILDMTTNQSSSLMVVNGEDPNRGLTSKKASDHMHAY